MHSSHNEELKSLISDFKSTLLERFDMDMRVEGVIERGKKKAIPTPAPKVLTPPPQVQAPIKKDTAPVIKSETPPSPPLKKPDPIKTFVPEKSDEKSHNSLNDVRHFYQVEAPNIKIVSIPESLRAPIEPKKGIVLFLAFSPSHLAFLHNVAMACENRFGILCEVQKVEPKYIWEDKHYKLVFASEYGLDGYDNLKAVLKDGNKPTERKLGNVTLIPLPDISMYLKEPKQKASLWAMLCQELPKLLST